MRHTVLKAYALAVCVLTASILTLTCSGPLWDGISDLVMGRVADNELYHFYQMELEPLCPNCNDKFAAIKSVPAIQPYTDDRNFHNRQADSQPPGELALIETEESEVQPFPLEAPLLARLGVALLAALVGFNHWRLYRYLSQPIA